MDELGKRIEITHDNSESVIIPLRTLSDEEIAWLKADWERQHEVIGPSAHPLADGLNRIRRMMERFGWV